MDSSELLENLEEMFLGATRRGSTYSIAVEVLLKYHRKETMYCSDISVLYTMISEYKLNIMCLSAYNINDVYFLVYLYPIINVPL